MLALLVLVILITLQMFRSTQTSFLPDEDQRVVFVSMDMPEGSTRDRTRDVTLRAVRLPEPLKCLPARDGLVYPFLIESGYKAEDHHLQESL